MDSLAKFFAAFHKNTKEILSKITKQIFYLFHVKITNEIFSISVLMLFYENNNSSVFYSRPIRQHHFESNSYFETYKLKQSLHQNPQNGHS
jgi:hypothetical protein